MELYIKNIEDNKFEIHYEDKRSILSEDRNPVKLAVKQSEKMELTKIPYFSVMEWKNKELKWTHWIKIILSILFMYIFDRICLNEWSLNDWIDPVSEKYMLIAEKEADTLTYHKGYFEPITGEYHYPYMTDEHGMKLKNEFFSDYNEIRLKFLLAKIYHMFTALLVACIFGIGINIICQGWFMMFLGDVVLFFVIWISISLKLDRKREKIIKQLDNDSIVNTSTFVFFK